MPRPREIRRREASAHQAWGMSRPGSGQARRESRQDRSGGPVPPTGPGQKCRWCCPLAKSMLPPVWSASKPRSRRRDDDRSAALVPVVLSRETSDRRTPITEDRTLQMRSSGRVRMAGASVMFGSLRKRGCGRRPSVAVSAVWRELSGSSRVRSVPSGTGRQATLVLLHRGSEDRRCLGHQGWVTPLMRFWPTRSRPRC